MLLSTDLVTDLEFTDFPINLCGGSASQAKELKKIQLLGSELIKRNIHTIKQGGTL